MYAVALVIYAVIVLLITYPKKFHASNAAVLGTLAWYAYILTHYLSGNTLLSSHRRASIFKALSNSFAVLNLSLLCWIISAIHFIDVEYCVLTLINYNFLMFAYPSEKLT